MGNEFMIGEKLSAMVERMVASYKTDERTHHINRTFLPSRSEIIEILELLLELTYPGYYGRQNLTDHNIAFHVGDLLPKVGEKLHGQIHQCLCYREELEGKFGGDTSPCDKKARRLTLEYLDRLPAIREMVAGDVQAAYDGDPASENTDEIILAYPGVLAVTVYRLAHELYTMDVPLMPRIMTEWAHGATGVDIHPGATIGRSFFIDHATGVVIGETTEIGDNVKLYQGVTLGALSFPKDERGRIIRGYKRHPTVEDNVTLYANAIVLGGDTRLGKSSVIGGSVFVTRSVPENCTVTLKAPELTIRNKKKRKRSEQDSDEPMPDFHI